MKNTITRAVSRENRKTGLTLEDVTVLIQDSMRADMPPTAEVRAEVGMRGQITRLSVSAEVSG